MTQVAVAFVAGILSFASPCVLPVLPGYVGYLAEGGGRGARWRAGFFVLGFGGVFVALGAAAGSAGQWLALHEVFLRQLGGLLVIVFGLQMLGLLGNWFRGTPRAVRVAGPLRPLVAGGAFAFGCSPCIGPVLGAILVLAGQSATAGRGATLLAVYAAGLALPLLAVAFGADGLHRLLGRLPAVERIAGGLLVAVGLLLYFGGLSPLSGLAAWVGA